LESGELIAMQNKRFETVYTQGVMESYKIIVDRETGINYLYVSNGSAGGLTVLLDSEGKPVTEKNK
jgi:hypothetical protein